MRSLSYRLLTVMFIVSLLAGCALPPPTVAPTNTPGSSLPPQIPEAQPTTPSATSTPVRAALVYALSVAAAKGFAAAPAAAVNVKPAVKAYNTDPRAASNAQLLDRLTPAQMALLQANGFVVVPAQIAQFYELYKDASEHGEPVFVTSDVLLHSYHILYDYTLRWIEANRLLADLGKLSQAMANAAATQYANASGEAKEAAKRNLAFFAVASALLDPEAKPPAEVTALVRAELTNIEAHRGFAPSPIFGYEEDYSQYVPRGHYTRSEELERYFRTMMWYGRMMFRLRPGNSAEAIAAGRRETRQALLITAALQNVQVGNERALTVWERIYEPTAFFVGASDDLTLYDYTQLAHEVYGASLSPDDLNDDARLESLISKAFALRPPKIVSSYVTDEEKPEEVIKGWRFMGQRFIPDSYMFQQLVYDKVGTQAQPRLFPKGLDVASVLGSERADGILRDVYGETKYARYDPQMTKLRQEFAALPQAQWTENLYWSWLHSLRALLAPQGQGYPAFMTNAAWVDKQLNTFLGSWTELRHDTLLYAKQSYTMRASGMAPEIKPAIGYVEPLPELYARLGTLVNQMRQGLEERGLLNDEYRNKLEQMSNLLAALQKIAEKELAGEMLSAKDAELLRGIGKTLEAITTFSAKNEAKITSEADTRVALVADVHTDVNTNQVLQEGVGDVFLIYVVTPSENGTAISQGGVFSYYEFVHPMADRLTDEKWQALKPKPALPVWSESFIASGR